MNTSRRAFVATGGAALVHAAGAEAPAQDHKQATLRVAACQILTYPEPARSAEKVCSWVERAAGERADVVLFPEATLCGYTCDPEYWKSANPEEFRSAEAAVIATAKRLNIAVIVGTAHWENGKVYNSVLAIDRDGSPRGRYSKVYRAEKWPTMGHVLPVFTIAGVKSCFIICHDVRYPELVRLPAIAGAQICYFASNESGLVEEHKLSAYRAMPISRATENSIFLVMANAPADAKNVRSPSQSHGNSKVIHPDGNVLIEAGYFEERLVCASIDPNAATRSMARRAVNEGTIISEWLRTGSHLVTGDIS
ncbi:MAG: carbon-nitrogen hydrolase family protein [Bryobacterales bacterium]|nr:carbon-nitrogen hydrolase family protein [Bryobacterales bacterium]